MFLRRLFLFPFAVLYAGITRLRNRLFDIGLKPSASFDIPIISVGNLSVGGTGKTPMVEHLIRLLSKQYSLATLSRGYGRQTKGMLVANDNDTAKTIGDEPLQLYQKFKGRVVVSVCEERVFAIPFLIDQFPELKVVLLDDAFQHRFLKPGFSILLTDFSKPFYNDFVLPAGNLRESRVGAKRADMVVVTKCPAHLSEDEMMDIEHKIRKYTHQHIFFSKIRYGTPVSVINNTSLYNDNIVLVSGIANAEPLVDYVQSKYKMIKHFRYKDHYSYNEADLLNIVSVAKESTAAIITTEKDGVKMEALARKHNLDNLYVIPIELEFLKNGSDFDAVLTEYVSHATNAIHD